MLQHQILQLFHDLFLQPLSHFRPQHMQAAGRFLISLFSLIELLLQSIEVFLAVQDPVDARFALSAVRHDRFICAAVSAVQLMIQKQPLLHIVKRLRIILHMIEQRPERADVLLDLIIGVAQRLGMCSDAVQVAGIFQRAHRPIQRRIAAVIPIQQIQRFQQLFLHRFGAVHHMDALFQLSGLIPTQLGGVDLIELFREIIEVFFVELFRQRLLHLFLQAVIRTVCCAHFLQQRVIGAIAVQQA